MPRNRNYGNLYPTEFEDVSTRETWFKKNNTHAQKDWPKKTVGFEKKEKRKGSAKKESPKKLVHCSVDFLQMVILHQNFAL